MLGSETLLEDKHVAILSFFLLSLILPLAICITKFAFIDRRAYAAKVLAKEFPTLADSYTFRFAVAKYFNVDSSIKESLNNYSRSRTIRDALLEMPSYLLPLITYAAICATGFYAAMVITVIAAPDDKYHFDNYLIYGMHAADTRVFTKLAAEKPGTAATDEARSGAIPAAPALSNNEQVEKIKAYGRGTIAVSVAGFIGAYLWTLIFLARRVTNFDLSPFSFLRATIQICLACFVCIFLRHLYDSVSQVIWETSSSSRNASPSNSSWLLVLAFLIGFYPALGLNYLQERFAFLRFKTRNASSDALSRELSLDMVDGIDSYIKFRLGEYEIEDIENLALANPIQLFIESPYTLRKIIDWVGQAQLILEIDNSKIADLRNLNIRTSLDFLRFGEREEGKTILGGLLHPTQGGAAGDNKLIGERLRTFEGKPHVKALQHMIEIIAGSDPPGAVDRELRVVAD